MGLEFLGIELDENRNKANEGLISKVGSPVTVRVIRTDEEFMIARSVCHLLKLDIPTLELIPKGALI